MVKIMLAMAQRHGTKAAAHKVEGKSMNASDGWSGPRLCEDTNQ